MELWQSVLLTLLSHENILVTRHNSYYCNDSRTILEGDRLLQLVDLNVMRSKPERINIL